MLPHQLMRESIVENVQFDIMLEQIIYLWHVHMFLYHMVIGDKW
jgi:hypothetical protein